MTELGMRYSRMLSLPEEEILQGTQQKTLRVNTLKIKEKELIKRLQEKGVTLKKIPHLPQAYTFESTFSLGATEEFLLGYYYLQEASSQLPVLALQNILKDNIKTATVLDMAAAPGSKTTQLAAVMQNQGTIIALDENANRIKALADNLERCGVTNTRAYLKDAQYARDLKQKYDAIILDAPCSGNFTLSDDWIHTRTLHDVKSKCPLQQELLEVGLSQLKPNGILIYSTCSLEPEENEGILTQALNDTCKIIPMHLSVGTPGLTTFDRYTFRDDCKHAVRIWPHKEHAQGFFIAAIQKNA